MFSNRVSQYLDRFSESLYPSDFLSQQPTIAAAASMICVPVMAPAANWQAYLYQMAYARAVAELAPPRHHRRFFSVWN